MPTYLLTWNPKRWAWDTLQNDIAEITKSGYHDDSWSIAGTRRILEGDRVFLLRQGTDPRGIVASGKATSGPYEGKHWNKERAAQGETTWYIDVRFDTILDADHEPILPRAELDQGTLRHMHWDTQGSGITIPDPIAAELEKRWAQFSGKVPQHSARIFGHVPGYPPGATFASRQALHDSGVHRPLQAGISGSANDGADSIIISGGYEDDVDEGDTITYTGHGGREPKTGKQIADQTLTAGNRALAKNQNEGLPVRVIRGSIKSGYRYDGLYRVEDHWHEKGKSGFEIYRFRLGRIPDDADPPPVQESTVPSLGSDEATASRPQRKETLVQRIVRDTKRSRGVKLLYDHHCQVCNERLETPAGPYSEAAHIQPLGKPHNGPDHESNIICLCPNHHVLFDTGAFSIADDLTLIGIKGTLAVRVGHKIKPESLRYRREHYSVKKN